MSAPSRDPAVDALDRHFVAALADLDLGDSSAGPEQLADDALDDELVELFDAAAASRHLDFAARDLQARGEGFYTIGPAGH